ncbi:Hypothetical predicted protein [Cloeon dipterum]|uniref:Platelet-derived growth factor (PDGF) family profile domain-containing protein n=1 Tax=Cloeon dipterum TaxID=197152 RepID=A0A8S1CM80_9INSE|nr:Hypothetical predicted protein [Cloeon dipterum]
MRSAVLCVTFVLGSLAACILAADDPIIFSGGSKARRPNRRPSVKGPCATCGHAEKRQTLQHREPEQASFPVEEEPYELPLDFYKKMNEIDDEFQFLALIGSINKELVNVTGLYDVDPGNPAIRNGRAGEVGIRFSGVDEIDGDEPAAHFAEGRRNAIERARQAQCIPENMTVPLINPNATANPFTIYFPNCIRLPRCNGCCNTPLLTCEPTITRLRSFRVLQTDLKNEKLSNIQRSTVIDVEEHLGCQCTCKVKAKDCNVFQKYNQKACRCVCVNKDDKDKCDLESKLKLWDMQTCQCKCREASECSTGFYFDEKTCSCKSDTLVYSR